MLDNYDQEDLREDYWNKCRSSSYCRETGSRMDHEAVNRIASEIKYKTPDKVIEILQCLKNWATLGIEGEIRWPSSGPNNTSVKILGDRVSDSLASGIKEDFLCGPIRKEDLPLLNLHAILHMEK